jgi:hypothetical protein
LNAYLQDVLCIESPSICAGLFEQGLTSFLDFETLTKKDITQICANVCRPGGLIPNPMLVLVQRMPFIAAEAPLARLTTVYRLKEVEDEETDDELKLPATLTKIDEVCVTLEDLDDYFRRKLGDSGAPLAYVTHDDPGLPVEDPGFGLPTFAE